MEIVTILGSNFVNKYCLIQEAIDVLAQKTGEIVLASSWYETEPWGFECDENFLNRVVVFNTCLSPFEFLHICLAVEKQLGRVRTCTGARYTSRPIDVDLLFCESQIIRTPELMVPHPRMTERNFVLAPLNEVMPDFVHPTLRKKVSTLFSECPDTLRVKLVKPC